MRRKKNSDFDVILHRRLNIMADIRFRRVFDLYHVFVAYVDVHGTLYRSMLLHGDMRADRYVRLVIFSSLAIPQEGEPRT